MHPGPSAPRPLGEPRRPVPPQARTPRDAPPRLWPLVVAVVLVEVVAVGLDLWLGGYDLVSTEERFNAAAGLQAACGHLDALRALRYRPFCGGCTAEALLAVPLFRTLGPAVLAWKLIPAGFHLLVAATATWLAGRAAGRRSAIAAGGLVLASPAAWRAMSLTGFGNHAEVMGLVLLAGALLVGGLDARRPVAGGLQVLAGGAVAGLATWFCYSAAAGLVATGLTGLIARSRRGWWVFPGIAAGLAPLWWEFQAWPGGRATAQVRLAGPSLAPPADLWRWFIGDLFSGSLWPQLQPGLVGGAWWMLLVGLAFAGVAGAARRSVAGRWLILTLFGLAVAMALRHDLWDDNPPLLGFDPFNFRYRVPLLVLLVPAAATVAGRGGRAAAVALAALVLPGLALRVVGWSGPPADLHRSVVIVADRPDATVPEGEPPRRLARALGRPQDLHAALAFLRSHADPLPQCRAEHVAELGRRAALASHRGTGPEVRRVLRAALAEGATIHDLVAGLESARIHDKVDPAELESNLAEVSPDLAAAWSAARDAPDPPERTAPRSVTHRR